MRDYVTVEQEYNMDALCYKETFRDVICLVGENNKSLFKKYYPLDRETEELTITQKYKLGITILFRSLHKSYSKRMIKKTVYLGGHASRYDGMYDYVISSSSSLFSRILDCINKNLTREQKNLLANINCDYLRYPTRVRCDYLYLAPIHCDIIITSSGIIEQKYKQSGQHLVRSIRV